MKHINSVAPIAIIALLVPVLAAADEEASNNPHVRSSTWGNFYAKTIPAERYGTKGTTRVYKVTKETEDALVATYPWYAPQLFLEGFLASPHPYIVQMGPWHRGHKPSADDLGFAIHEGKRRIRRYSTLDLQKLGLKPQASVSHYTMFRKVLGFRRPYGNELYFELLTHDERTVSFHAATGELVSPTEEAIQKQLYDARSRYSSLKYQWFAKFKDERPDAKTYRITENDLRSISKSPLPKLPRDYVYIPGAVFEAVRFDKGGR